MGTGTGTGAGAAAGEGEKDSECQEPRRKRKKHGTASESDGEDNTRSQGDSDIPAKQAVDLQKLAGTVPYLQFMAEELMTCALQELDGGRSRNFSKAHTITL
jgi:hypothetical protein